MGIPRLVAHLGFMSSAVTVSASYQCMCVQAVFVCVWHIWSICAFDQMRCASGKCTFDQSPNHDSNPNTNPNPNPNPNRNTIPNPNPTLNLASTKCCTCMQLG